MSMGMEVMIFLVYAAGMLLIYLAGRFLLVPIKWTGRLLLSSAVGGVLILIINFLGGNFGIFLPLNPITAAITGILGVPGLVLLLIYFI